MRSPCLALSVARPTPSSTSPRWPFDWVDGLTSIWWTGSVDRCPYSVTSNRRALDYSRTSTVPVGFRPSCEVSETFSMATSNSPTDARRVRSNKAPLPRAAWCALVTTRSTTRAPFASCEAISHLTEHSSSARPRRRRCSRTAVSLCHARRGRGRRTDRGVVDGDA